MAELSSPVNDSVLFWALKEVLNDPSFKTSSNVAANALQSASKLFQWCQDVGNEPVLRAFCQRLLDDLTIPFAVSSERRPLNRKELWRSFWSVRSSTDFIARWTSLCESAQALPTPILYQHLTDLIFRRLICEKYKIPDRRSATNETNITYNEANVLRYAAGYVVRQTVKKIKKMNHKSEKELLCCVSKLIKGGKENVDNESHLFSEEWTALVDRGGLWYVHETTFHLFCAFEKEVRRHVTALHSTNPSPLSEFLEKLLRHEDVQFYWCIATADFEIEDIDLQDLLLRMIAKLYLTIRGFSYASAWLEHYKQTKKKSIERSKSLRRDLYTDINN